MIKAVAYARFSSENQRNESIDAQLRAINIYCEQNKIELLDSYIDIAKSATTDARPAFQRMVADAEDGDFQMIIVHKLDRFSRNRKDSIVYKALLKKNGVEVVSVTEPLSNSPESVILEAVLEGMAEYYSLNLSREVKKGLKENALKGQITGGSAPLGYDIDRDAKKLVINEKEANAVRLIFNGVLEGQSYNTILYELNLLGYKTKKGSDFGKTALISILRNEKYKGTYLYCMDVGKNMKKRYHAKGEKDAPNVIRIENCVPPIVSAEVFDRVQEILDGRKNKEKDNGSKEDYLLSGKIRCGECGASYCGSRKYSGRNKKLHTTYRCNDRVMKTGRSCSNKEINKDKLEEKVLRILAEIIFGDDHINELIGKYKDEFHLCDNKTYIMIHALEKNLNSIDLKINNITNLIAETGNAHLLSKLDSLNNERELMEKRIKEKRDSFHPVHFNDNAIREGILHTKERLCSGKLEGIRSIINLFIQNILIYEDHIDIRINSPYIYDDKDIQI